MLWECVVVMMGEDDGWVREREEGEFWRRLDVWESVGDDGIVYWENWEMKSGGDNMGEG